MRRTITREEAYDMENAHAQGFHAELPREGCPLCEDRDLRSYPTAAQVAKAKEGK
jgi:hypothetical protein